MYHFVRHFLFKMDGEKAHNFSLNSLQKLHALGLLPKSRSSSVPTKLMGLDLPNPIGLAAGLDKNGDYIDALAALGFGFIEIGTVTPKPQAGNPKPRLFRIPEHQAIINRMGFNNKGIDYLISNIRKAKYSGILGINIGKNATTPIESAVDDYLICLEKAYDYASYITVNISSPNTKNLRALQEKDELFDLLKILKIKQEKLASQYSKYVPIAVKIAPDLDYEQIKTIAQVIKEIKLDGVIATNTTIDKSTLNNHPLSTEEGGLSGFPVQEKANLVLKQLATELGNQIPIIGVGGIFSGQDAIEKFRLGATAVQIFSGMIYQGPELVAECTQACLSPQID